MRTVVRIRNNFYACVQLYAYKTHLLRIRMCDTVYHTNVSNSSYVKKKNREDKAQLICTIFVV